MSSNEPLPPGSPRPSPHAAPSPSTPPTHGVLSLASAAPRGDASPPGPQRLSYVDAGMGQKRQAALHATPSRDAASPEKKTSRRTMPAVAISRRVGAFAPVAATPSAPAPAVTGPARPTSAPAGWVVRDRPTAPASPNTPATSTTSMRTRWGCCATRAEARRRGTRPAPSWSASKDPSQDPD